EIVSLFDHLDREENTRERAFYMTAWNGDQPYTVDRVRSGSLRIKGLCLSVLGSAQPGRIGQYLARAVRGGRGGDGLVQRFVLLVWPDVSTSWTNVDRPPDKQAQRMATEIYEGLNGLDWHAIRGQR